MLRTLSAGVAHEIRNPLAVIQSLVEVLAKKTQDTKQQELAESIVSEVRRLNRFLGEFLQYGKPAPLEYEQTCIQTLVKKALTFAIPPEKNPNIIVRTDIPNKIPRIKIDPNAYHQVLVNAILNAMQAMRNKGTLEISAKIRKQHFIIEIKDSGPGISSENLEKIFLPFFTTKRSGSGLGLAISQQIIKQHSGRLYFKNNIEGKGVTLVIDVPQG